ncbi:MAG: hypothetical protein KGN76_08630 [Acidobacteriota bacterium]|nr:hypothetical protein [Acidobacteriota bacterium]
MEPRDDDAALVVLGADPPISGDELALVTAIASRVDDFIFVLNKADRLDAADRTEAARFTARVLHAHLGWTPQLFETSASDRRKGRVSFDWPAVEDALTGLARASAAVVDRVRRRAATRLVRRLRVAADEQARALRQPLETSEQRLAAIRRWTTEAQYAVQDLGRLLAVQHRDLTRTFEAMRATFVSAAADAAGDRLTLALPVAGRGSVRRRQTMKAVRDLARELVLDWIARVEPDASRLYQEGMARFVRTADALVERLAATGDAAGCLARAPSRRTTASGCAGGSTSPISCGSRVPDRWTGRSIAWCRASGGSRPSGGPPTGTWRGSSTRTAGA